MTEHKRRSGLMGSDRMVGNFVPKESYSDNSNNKNVSTHSKERKNIKLPADIYKQMDSIKHVAGLNYNYEVLQLLMDSYLKNKPESFRKHVKELMEM